MSLAAAVIVAVIAATLHWKHKVPRFVAWLLLVVGLGAAQAIAGFFGGLGSMTVGGVAIFTILAIFGLIAFYEEAVKSNGLHRIRTPIIAVLTGVSVMTAGGATFVAIQEFVNSTSPKVDQAVTDNLNGK